MGPYLLTIAELEPILGRDVTTLHGWIRDGKWPEDIPILMWSGMRVVRKADVERFVGCSIAVEAVAS